MEIETRKLIKDIDAVNRLRKILFFQIAIPLPLGVILFFLQIAIVRSASDPIMLLVKILLGIVIGDAVLFTPYLLYVLIKEKRYGWITTFFFMVVLPYIIILPIFYDYILLTAWLLLPVILLYCYYFLIKYSIDDWLKEYYTHESYEEQKRESAQRRKEEERWL